MAQHHVIDRKKAKVGVFITLAEPTGPMRTEAVKAGFYETDYGKFPKIQLLTIAELFAGSSLNCHGAIKMRSGRLRASRPPGRTAYPYEISN